MDAHELQRLQKIANEAHKDVYGGAYGDPNKLQLRVARDSIITKEIQERLNDLFIGQVKATLAMPPTGLDASGAKIALEKTWGKTINVGPGPLLPPGTFGIDMGPYLKSLTTATGPLQEYVADMNRRFSKQLAEGFTSGRQVDTAKLEHTVQKVEKETPPEIAEEIRSTTIAPALEEALDNIADETQSDLGGLADSLSTVDDKDEEIAEGLTAASPELASKLDIITDRLLPGIPGVSKQKLRAAIFKTAVTGVVTSIAMTLGTEYALTAILAYSTIGGYVNSFDIRDREQKN